MQIVLFVKIQQEKVWQKYQLRNLIMYYVFVLLLGELQRHKEAEKSKDT